MSEKAGRTVTIDGTEYDLDNLSAQARAALVDLNATDAELRRLQVQANIAQAARKAFADRLRATLPEVEETT